MPPNGKITVFAPALFVTITIEAVSPGDTDEIHIHPGGQGLWISRMLRNLEESPILCGPIGGETGKILNCLIPDWEIEFSPIEVASASPAYVDDRRGGDRSAVARAPAPELSRHEIDDVYGRVLDHSLASGICVVTGRVNERFPLEFYQRLGADLANNDVRVVADMHGAELEAFLDGGQIDMLKISDDEMDRDGMLQDLDRPSVLDAMERLEQRGVHNVIASRASMPTLARLQGSPYVAVGPDIEPIDFRGAGDSMTAALAAATFHGMETTDALRLACASGAANVTRRGLGSASKELIEQLFERVEVKQMEAAGDG